MVALAASVDVDIDVDEDVDVDEDGATEPCQRGLRPHVLYCMQYNRPTRR